jgi:hypothetical protein
MPPAPEEDFWQKMVWSGTNWGEALGTFPANFGRLPIDDLPSSTITGSQHVVCICQRNICPSTLLLAHHVDTAPCLLK